ncbi:MAG: hypothetical protein FWE37_06365, partial [Spirochaetaceae bacterium]|nr:hypothetical protein [Spirochaetaceae bacterium]
IRCNPFTPAEVVEMYRLVTTLTFRRDGQDVPLMRGNTLVESTPLLLDEVFKYFRGTFLRARESEHRLTNPNRLSLRDEDFNGTDWHYTIINGVVRGTPHFILADGRGQFLYNSSDRLVYPVDANNNPLANTISWRGIEINRRRVIN